MKNLNLTPQQLNDLYISQAKRNQLISNIISIVVFGAIIVVSLMFFCNF